MFVLALLCGWLLVSVVSRGPTTLGRAPAVGKIKEWTCWKYMYYLYEHLCVCTRVCVDFFFFNECI